MTAMRRLFHGTVRKRRGEAAEKSMMLRLAEFGTRMIKKSESPTDDTFAPSGSIAADLWPVRGGAADDATAIGGSERY